MGTWLADEVAVTVWVTVAVAVWGAGPVEVTPGVPGAELLPARRLAGRRAAGGRGVRDPVGEVVTEGVNTVGVDVDEDELQAETATGARPDQGSPAEDGQPGPIGQYPRSFRAPSWPLLLHRADDDCVSQSRRQKPVPDRNRVTDLVAARAATGRSRKRGRP